MLRDEGQVALNDLIDLCEAAGEDYDRAAEAAGADELALLFAELATQRRAMEAELRAEVRRLGDLPHAPDPDRHAVQDLFARIRKTLAPDELGALIEDCQNGDRHLAERIDSAIATPLPDASRAVLRRHRHEITAALGRLAVVKARLG